MASFSLWLLLLATFYETGFCAFKLSTYFGDHMVLQRAPQQAVLWGTADTEGDTVTAKVTGQGSQSAQVTTKVASGKWKLKLPAQTDKGPFSVDVTSSDGHVTLKDVLFGDVWLCSGQSNMGFTLNHVMNATAELQRARQFTDIRFMQARRVQSNTSLDDISLNFPWTGPDSQYIEQSSAVCWLFGEYLYQKLKYPIGLVQSSWGGTRIEAWSPPEAIAACTQPVNQGSIPSMALWNAMIHPFLRTTLFGALWYQGESNSGVVPSTMYACQIEAMVREWRKSFQSQSMGETSNSFPFGYVQLAGNAHNQAVGGFPGERWAQTANYGYSPNPALPHTFMAVAMDLPDFESPYGTVHPRYKQDVAQRLVLGALNVAYGQTDVVHQGPFPTGLRKDQKRLEIVYNQGRADLTVKNTTGFEVCCNANNATHCEDHPPAWVAAPITEHRSGHVTIDTSGCGMCHVVGIRYEWRTSPCEYKQCSLYDSVSGLPAPPYISFDLKVNSGPEIIG